MTYVLILILSGSFRNDGPVVMEFRTAAACTTAMATMRKEMGSWVSTVFCIDRTTGERL